MNDRLLKRLILKEIRSVLRESWEDEPDDDEDEEGKAGDSFGIEYQGDTLSPEEFVEKFDLAADPEALKNIYDAAQGPLKKSAKTHGGGKSIFYFQRHPWSESGMQYGGYDSVLIAADSRSELEEAVNQAEQDL